MGGQWGSIRIGGITAKSDICKHRTAYIYIDSAKYFSWEQFFTELLIQLTSERDYMRYGKQTLAPFYLQAENIQKVINAMERD